MGGEVPYSYYLRNSAPVAKGYMETSNLIAGASGFKKLKYKVDVENSILWSVIAFIPFLRNVKRYNNSFVIIQMGVYDGGRRHRLQSLLQECRRRQRGLGTSE